MEASASIVREYREIEIRILPEAAEGYPVNMILDRQQRVSGGVLRPDILSWSPGGSTVKDGTWLFERLIVDTGLDNAWQDVKRSDRLRRIRLHITPKAQELHAVPWELLADPDPDRPEALALSGDTPFSRDVTVDRAHVRPVAEGPIKILVAMPRLELHSDSIKTGQERVREFFDKLTWPGVEVAYVPPPVTIDKLDAELMKGYHLLYFFTVAGPDNARPLLMLDDEDDMPVDAGEAEVSSVLRRHRRTLRLVVFASHGTAEIGLGSQAFALSAVKVGVPATIGTRRIRGSLRWQEALAFSSAFTFQLLRRGQVDLACNDARASLVNEPGASWHRWVVFDGFHGTPVFDPSSVELPLEIRVSEEVLVGQSAPVEPVESAPEDVGGPSVGRVDGAVSDEVAQEDQLGFDHYVEAFARLICSKATEAPLTIGIFGSWGMGKSFLLQNIERRVGELAAPQDLQVHTITFNAWEYSANKEIWPGLVRKTMQEIEKRMPFAFRGKRSIHRIWRGFVKQLKQKRTGTIIIASALTAVLSLAIWMLKYNTGLSMSLFATLGVGGVLGLIKLIFNAISEPLGPWITALFPEENGYGMPIDYMDRIHQDLDCLGKELGENRRVLILIDDLDRCKPEKAVEVLQAIKLLLNFPFFFVCLGIDARVITRAVEKHYQGLLGPAGASGYEYLDKIIQIPFRIPEPNPDEIAEFINKLMGEPSPPMHRPATHKIELAGVLTSEGQVTMDVQRKVEAGTDGESVPPSDAELDVPVQEDAKADAFSHDELVAFQELKRYLRPNPRHIKRLTNVYRLVRSLAKQKDQPFILSNPAATIRWLVLCAQWPFTARVMLSHFAGMLADEEPGSPTEWPSRAPLEYLLEKAQEEIGKSDVGRNRQARLDDDLGHLGQLVNLQSGSLGWDDLDVIRQYTINFNPAVDAENLFLEDQESER